jgi:hypothetical protein
LPEVAIFELLHEGFAAEKIGVEIGGEPGRDHEKLVVGNFRERNGAARGNEMRAPLEDEAGVPERENSEKANGGGESGALRAEELSGAVEENGEAEDEKRSERDEEAVAVGRDASPVRITGNEKIKSEKGGEKGSGGAALPTPKHEETDGGEKKNGRPGEQTMIGREKHG